MWRARVAQSAQVVMLDTKKKKNVAFSLSLQNRPHISLWWVRVEFADCARVRRTDAAETVDGDPHRRIRGGVHRGSLVWVSESFVGQERSSGCRVCAIRTTERARLVIISRAYCG